jgi:muramoyltetrapeptide carboxypeptidase
MRTPPYLKPGDTIGIAASARKISEAEIEPSLRLIRSLGFKVKCASNLFLEENQYAGNDLMRTQGFQQLLEDADVRAILCARGGYGTVRIIDKLDFSSFITNPKWVAGYSDVTVLHSHIHTHFNIETLHSTMPLNFPTDGRSNESVKTLFSALTGKNISYDVPSHKFNKSGKAAATVVGGNLSILYSLNGTASDINTDGKILFIEDLDEYLYHIDRMMQNLKRSEKLKNLKGLIVGGMSDMNDNTIPFGKDALEIINETIAEYDYPVCFDFPAGHNRDNHTLILGREAELEVKENNVSLKFNAN